MPSSKTKVPSTSSSTTRSKKRGRTKQSKHTKKIPTRLIDNESIDCVASPIGGSPIRTPVASTDDKDILIERLQKEVVDKFEFTLSKRRQRDTSIMLGGKTDIVSEVNDGKGRKRKRRKVSRPPAAAEASTEMTFADIVKRRLIAGTNQCTRALEASASSTGPRPSLVLLSRDVRPPTILAHIPVLCKRMGIPALVLPGRASSELGKALGGKSVAVAVFLPSTAAADAVTDGQQQLSEDDVRECHRRIDSYVKFAHSKVPTNKAAS